MLTPFHMMRQRKRRRSQPPLHNVHKEGNKKGRFWEWSLIEGEKITVKGGFL